MEVSEVPSLSAWLTEGSVILLDGGTATELRRAGLRGYRTPELLNVLAPEAVLDVHRSYVEAGARAILTNTFGANRFRLAAVGRADKLREICQIAVAIARKAAASQSAVLGDIGPMRFYARELGLTSDEDLVQAYEETAGYLADAEVDGLFLETLPTLDEARVAFDAVRRVAPSLPVFVSFYLRNVEGRFTTLDEVVAEDAFRVLLDRGAAAVGANCCLGVREMTGILTQVAPYNVRPLIAKPNAGLPHVEGEQVVYPEKPEDFARAVGDWVRLGARFVGGCCGTGPEHIRAMRAVLETAKAT